MAAGTETTGDGEPGDGDGAPGDGDGGPGDGDGAPGDGDGDGSPVEVPSDCADLLSLEPNTTTGVYMIDPDGPGGEHAYDVLCDMDHDGGGWTLVFTASDDGIDTWTWANRTRLGSTSYEVGSPQAADHDFMSPAYHQLGASDLLFIHQPSGVWAAYAGAGNGSTTMGDIVAAVASPLCDYALAGNGLPMTAGTLTVDGRLCDTDLYFNLGDHEVDLSSCMDLGSGSNSASYGPVWNADKGAGCPFDDPAEFGLGPHGPCGACPNDFPTTEFSHLGYGNALLINTGAAGAAENYMQLYVR